MSHLRARVRGLVGLARSEAARQHVERRSTAEQRRMRAYLRTRAGYGLPGAKLLLLAGCQLHARTRAIYCELTYSLKHIIQNAVGCVCLWPLPCCRQSAADSRLAPPRSAAATAGWRWGWQQALLASKSQPEPVHRSSLLQFAYQRHGFMLWCKSSFCTHTMCCAVRSTLHCAAGPSSRIPG